MIDNQSDILQERQPKTLASYKNYKIIAKEELPFSEFSTKMKDPEFAAGVYDQFTKNEAIAPAIKSTKEEYLTQVQDETWAWSEDALNNKHLNKDSWTKIKQAEEEALEKFPDAEVQTQSTGANVMGGSTYGANRMAQRYVEEQRQEFITSKRNKILSESKQRAIEIASEKLATEIKPTATATEIISAFDNEIGYSSESINRDKAFEEGVYRPKDEADYVYNGLARVSEASVANAKKLEESLGSENVKSYIDVLVKYAGYADQIEEAKTNGDTEKIQQIAESDEFKSLLEMKDSFDKNPDYQKYLDQRILSNTVSKKFEDINNIDPEWFAERKQKQADQKAVEERHRVWQALSDLPVGFGQKLPVGKILAAGDVGYKSVLGAVTDTAVDLLSIPNIAVSYFSNERGSMYELQRWASETLSAAEVFTQPSYANRRIYEDVAKIKDDKGKVYEAVIDNGEVSAVYDDQGFAADQDKYNEIAGSYDPNTTKTSTQWNKMSTWAQTLKVTTDLAVLMAGTKGLTGAIRVGTKGLTGTTKLSRALASAGFQTEIAPRIGMYGAMTAQIQNDYYQEAIAKGFSPREAAVFSLSASTAVAAVNQFNPQFYLMGESRKATQFGVKKAWDIISKGGTTKQAIAQGIGFSLLQGTKEGLEEVAEIPAENLIRMIMNKGLDPRNNLDIQNDIKDYAESFTLGAVVGVGSATMGINSKSRMQKEALYAVYNDQSSFFDLIDRKIGGDEMIKIGDNTVEWSLGDSKTEAIKQHYKEVFESVAHVSKAQNLSDEEELQLIGKMDDMFRAKENYVKASQSGNMVTEAETKKVYQRAENEIKSIMLGNKSLLKGGTKTDFSDNTEIDPDQVESALEAADFINAKWDTKILNIDGKKYEITDETEDAYIIKGDLTGFGKDVKVKKAGLKNYSIELPDVNPLEEIRKVSGAVEEAKAATPQGLEENQESLERVKKIFEDKGLKFELISDDQFKKTFGASARGVNVQQGEDGTIYLNKDKMIDNTVFHEALHSIMTMANVSQEQLGQWQSELGKVKGFSKYMAQAEQSTAQGLGENATPEDIAARVNEEAVVEFMADVAAGNVSLEIEGVREALIDMYKAAIGDAVNLENIKDADLITFAKSMASVFKGDAILNGTEQPKKENTTKPQPTIAEESLNVLNNQKAVDAIEYGGSRMIRNQVSMAQRAEDMLSKGFNEQMVKATTGHSVVDGQLKSDFGDISINITGNKKTGNLKDILNTKELFDVYPTIGNMLTNVVIDPTISRSYSTVNSNNRIDVYAPNENVAAEELAMQARNVVATKVVIPQNPAAGFSERELPTKTTYRAVPETKFQPAPPVETPEFKKWFGKSKVVNDKGEPMVVYHGTQNNFTEFEGGSFFTDDYMNADGYAGGENIIEAYLSIKNPLIIDAQGRNWDNLNTPYGTSTQEIVATVDENKYDGIVFKNIKDNWSGEEELGDAGDIYFAFKPNQVKSATSNVGTFDKTNPDIRYQSAFDNIYSKAKRDAKWVETGKQNLPESGMTKEELEGVLRGGRFGMLTGENPNGKKASNKKNLEANNRAFEWLVNKGYDPKLILGKYGNNEVSFFVPDLTTKDAAEFATEFNQEAVATDKGYVYKDGSYNPIIENSLSFENKADFFSTIKVNGEPVNFSLDYDFGTTIKPEEPNIKAGHPKYPALTEDGQGNYVFYHKSGVAYDIVDPSKFGRNRITSREEQADYSQAPASFYYTRWKDSEKIHGNVINAVKVPMSKVYDANTDPDNLIDEAKKRFRKARGEYAAFSGGAQIAWVTKIANEKGYLMTVADWNVRGVLSGVRAQSGIALEATQGELYDSNMDKGWVTKKFPTQREKLQEVYNKINDYKGDLKQYDEAYRLRADAQSNINGEWVPWTQEKITDIVHNSNLPQDLINQYDEALKPTEKDYSFLPEQSDAKYQPILTQANDVLDMNDDAMKVLSYQGLKDVSAVAYNPNETTTERDDRWREKVKEALPVSNISNKYEIQDIINNKNFAVVTAEDYSLSNNQNMKAMDDAFNWLINKRDGLYNPIPVVNGSNVSLMVGNMNTEDAIDFAKTFNQKSIQTNKGIIYQDGSYNPIRRSQINMNTEEDYMAVNIDGEVNQIGLSYDKNIRVYPTDPLYRTTIAPKIAKATDGGYVFHMDNNGLHTEATKESTPISVPKSRVYAEHEDAQDTRSTGVTPNADISVDINGNVSVLNQFMPNKINKEDILPDNGIARIEFGYPENNLVDKILESSEEGSIEYQAAIDYREGNTSEEEFFSAINNSNKLSPSIIEAATMTDDIDYSRNINRDYSPPMSEAVELNSEAINNIPSGKTSIINVSSPEALKMADESVLFQPAYSRTELPVKTFKEVIEKYGNKVIVINSDMTGVGEIELPNGEIADVRGGIDYMSFDENMKAKIGFSTTSDSKIKFLNTKALEAWGQEKGFVAIMVQKPEAMMGNSYALNYTIAGINELFDKKLITDKEFANEVVTALSSRGFVNANISSDEQKMLKKLSENKKTAWKESKEKQYREELLELGVDKMNHNQLEEWLANESFNRRKYFNIWMLGNFNERDFTENSLIHKSKVKWIEDRKTGKNFGEQLPSNAIKGLLLQVGQNGRHYSKLDFYENFADKRNWSAWKKSPLLIDPKTGKEKITRGGWGHLSGGFEYQAGRVTEGDGVVHPMFNSKFYGVNPVRFDKAYNLNAILDKYGAGSPMNEASISAYKPHEFDVNRLDKGSLKFQPASAKDEIRIKEVAEKFSDLPQAYLADLISKKTGMPKAEVLRIMTGNKNPNPDTQVKEKRKTAQNADVKPEIIERESDNLREYIVRSQDLGDAEAEAIIEKFGEDQVMSMIINPPAWLLGDVRVLMTKQMIDRKTAAVEGSSLEEQNRVYDEINMMRSSIHESLTKAGQMISAARVLSLGTPESLAREVDSEIKKKNKKDGKEEGLTPEEIDSIKELKGKQDRANTGLPKTKATQELENEIQRIKFKHGTQGKKISNILEAIWYSNILSGASTHNRNIFANFTQWIGEMTTGSIKSIGKGDLITPFKMLGGSLSGLRRGLTAGVYTQLYGTRLDRGDKTEVLPILEWWRYDTGNKFVDKILNNSPWGANTLKHVGRLLSAGDAIFYHMGYEMKAAQMATKIAKDNRRKNPKNVDFRTVNQILYNDHESIQRAKDQAKSEGFNQKGLKGKLEYKIRVKEILEQQRGKEMAEKSDDFAARMTFNYAPEGFLGGWYRTFNTAANEQPLVKTFVPFARIVTNVTNRYLDWTPWGAVRAAKGKTKIGKGEYRKLSKDEKADLAIKSLVGQTLGFMLVGASSGDDPWLEITGNLTGDSYKDYQLQGSGMRKYSMRLKGSDKWYSYVDTPLFFLLAGIGTLNDVEKYGHEEDELTTNRMLEIAASGAVGAMVESTWMMGISDMIKSIDPERMKQGDSEFSIKLFEHAMKTMQSVAIGNWAVQANREWLEMNNDPIKRAEGLQRLYRDIPYVQNSLDDIISAFGNPVTPNNSEKIFFPFHSAPDTDPVAKLFTDNGVFMSRPQEFDIYDLDNNESYTASDDEIYDYAKLRGELVREITLKNWDAIESAEPEMRKEILESIKSTASDAAQASMYKGVDKEELIKTLVDSFVL